MPVEYDIACIIICTGILAGIWPCGVITLACELFGSESLSQVYGQLHYFFSTNNEHLKDVGEFSYV